MTDSIYNAIIEMDNFILSCNKEVYILDSDAALYMIPIDRYHKDYDMFNKGNFGSRGEEGKIEDLKEEKDIIVLIKKDGIARIGEILIFDIYIKE